MRKLDFGSSRPPYEAPQVTSLGALGDALGGECLSGASANQGCADGSTNAQPGSSPGVGCGTGTTNTGMNSGGCGSGSTNSGGGGGCLSGSTNSSPAGSCATGTSNTGAPGCATGNYPV